MVLPDDVTVEILKKCAELAAQEESTADQSSSNGFETDLKIDPDCRLL